MELIEVAQLVTGLATLIVASVLIWQMFIQKKTLDIAHNDADSSMSLTAVENKINLNTWFSTNSSIEMMEKMDESLESLNPKEKDILSSYVYGHVLLLITELVFSNVYCFSKGFYCFIPILSFKLNLP